MRCTLPQIWGPLLAVLLAGPLIQRSPSWGVVVGGVDVSSGPTKAVLPSARLQRTLLFRAPLDRQGLLLGPALGVENPGRVASAWVIVSLADQAAAPRADTARHFPLFPTGPPSHS